MATLGDVSEILARNGHLVVLAIAREDGRVHASLVSGGVLDDPVDGTPSLGLVAGGTARKLALLRGRGHATGVATHGYEWVAVSGAVRLVGPDDASAGLDVPAIIRSVFVSAGGQHEDWAAFDRVMAEERRCAVFVHADAVASNG